jgi:hypothetical protein
MEQDAFTEDQGTLFGDPFMDLDDISVVDDAAQRARTFTAVMAAAASSGDDEKGLTAPVLVEGPTSTVVLTKALRTSLRTTLESIRLMRPPSLRGDSGCRSLYSTVPILLFQLPECAEG